MLNDPDIAWNKCLVQIKERIGNQAFETWFKPIKPVKIENNLLTIQVPSQFFYEWLEDNYVELLRDVLDEQLGKDFQLEYSVVIDQGDAYSKPYTVQLPIRLIKSGCPQIKSRPSGFRNIIQIDPRQLNSRIQAG